MPARLSALILVFAAAVACSRGTSGRIEHDPVEVRVEHAYALQVPVGARVAASSDLLTVDAPNGSHWFDVQFLAADAVPQTVFVDWAQRTCASHVIDRLENPIPNVTTVGGFCTIEGRRHWLIGTIEPWGDRKIATLYVADAAQITIEDAWVDYTRTALTVVPGNTPLLAVTPEEVREAARAAQQEGAGPEQVPGGGVLWGRISRRLAPFFAARDQRLP